MQMLLRLLHTLSTSVVGRCSSSLSVAHVGRAREDEGRGGARRRGMEEEQEGWNRWETPWGSLGGPGESLEGAWGTPEQSWRDLGNS